MKSTRRTSDASLNNVEGTMPGVALQSSRREQSMARSLSRSCPLTQDEQPLRRIDRKRAFGQSTGGLEVKDTHHGNTPGEKGSDAQSE